MAVGPSFGQATKVEIREKTFKTPGILAKAGGQVSIITDAPVIPQQYLPLCAGLCMGAGLEREEALKAITIYAAEAAGIDGKVGSLAPGKDADLVIYEEDADPCGPYARPSMVFINGQQVV